MLGVDNIIVRYDAAYALKGINLKVDDREFVSVIGPNGVGKTTLLRAISRLVDINSGVITFLGERIDHLDSSAVVKKGIIHVPEGRKLVGTASVLDNLKLGAYLQWNKIQKLLPFVYEMFPILKEREKQQVRTLSGGEQQMVAIGRALMGNPKLLLLDEVTFGLSPKIVELIASKLLELNRTGISILLAEQNAELALSISNRCYVMEHYGISKEGNSWKLRDDPEIRAAYLGL